MHGNLTSPWPSQARALFCVGSRTDHTALTTLWWGFAPQGPLYPDFLRGFFFQLGLASQAAGRASTSHPLQRRKTSLVLKYHALIRKNPRTEIGLRLHALMSKKAPEYRFEFQTATVIMTRSLQRRHIMAARSTD